MGSRMRILERSSVLTSSTTAVPSCDITMMAGSNQHRISGRGRRTIISSVR